LSRFEANDEREALEKTAKEFNQHAGAAPVMESINLFGGFSGRRRRDHPHKQHQGLPRVRIASINFQNASTSGVGREGQLSESSGSLAAFFIAKPRRISGAGRSAVFR
jgi:hypothetical protein